jgi:enamine deaminase RidA (YjgF/YER057c/UK114 family)
MHAERRLAELGLPLDPLADNYALDTSGAKFVSHLAVGELLYLSGTVPERDGLPYLTGIVGAGLTIEQGYEAARYAALSALIALHHALGDLDRMQQVVQMTGWVNSAPGFNDQPRVINGATDLLVEVYGQRGLGTRAAIGCTGLGYGSSVEIFLIVRYDGGPVSEPMPTAGATGG